MLGKLTLNEKRSLVAAIAVVFALAAIFVMYSANSASALPFAFKGQVIAVDASAKTLTVKATEESSLASMGGQYTFRLNELSGVVMCGIDKDIKDIRAGDDVTVWYHEEGTGNILADSIDLSSPNMKC